MAIPVLYLFFPFKIVLLRCFNGAISQALRIITRHHQLHAGKEVSDKIFLLVIEVLPNTLRDRHRRAFQLNHAHSNTVNIQHYVWAFFVLALNGHFFGNGKIVCFWVFPVNQPHGFIKMTSTFFIFHAVTQQAINLFVGVIELFTFAQRCCRIQLANGTIDQRLADTAFF